ncbi:MAG: hypothetical protein JWN78_813 [Bacteroidota bacterium]|nr:hypothetical protein [Bacteroidota bacterium]
MRRQFGRNKIIILLGAGASCDAHILNSYQMISEIEQKLNDSWSDYKNLYNYIQSSHFHLERIKGVSAKDIIFNIENLVALLDIIIKISKKDLEVYPFVGSWEKELIAVTGNNFEQANLFKNKILTKLRDEWLSPADFKVASAYYKKLKETGYTYPLKIFSLNYDMCVEENLQGENASLERGFNDERIWDYRLYDLDGDDASDYYLYKLHGSLDWVRDDKDRLTFVDLVQRNDPLKMEIIFGTQNKLQSFDPYFFYFYSFREASFEAELIVTSGYGFMDKHINDNLINSFKVDPNKKLLANIFDVGGLSSDKCGQFISEKLQIDRSRIVVQNKFAKDFFTNDLNVDYFSSLFPDTNTDTTELPV